MKKLIIITLLALISLGITKTSAAPHKKADSVWICVSRGSVAYHTDRYCKGLARCKHQIIKVSLSDAINEYHLRACRVCTK